MLATLSEAVFDGLEDAYGPAVDVAGMVRAIASTDEEGARAALGDLAAHVFHQGSYFSATAAAVPFLIEIAGADVPARADVLLFLADMAGEPADPDLAYNPYLFRSTPGAPDYPEAVATVRAIAAAHATSVRALEAKDPAVRACAAFLLSRLGGGSALIRASKTEKDEATSIALALAAARARTLRPHGIGLANDVLEALLVGEAPLEDETRASLRKLLLVGSRFPRRSMPFFDGDLVGFAAHALAQPGGADEAARFELLASCLAERLARGETIAEPSAGFLARVCDEEAPKALAIERDDAPLRSIATAMAILAFGEGLRAQKLLRREELTAIQRRTLELTRDHGIPLPVVGAPWISRAAMDRFLRGGGPLDRAIVHAGKVAPLYVHLGQPDVDAVLGSAVSQLPEDALVDVAIDVLGGAYGLTQLTVPTEAMSLAIERHIEPVALRSAKLDAYATMLLARIDEVTGAQARFALLRSIRACVPVDATLDALAARAIGFLRERGRDWLAAFPEPRRSAIVASFGNSYLLGLFRDGCEPKTLEAALMAAFAAPGCKWLEHEAVSVLGTVADTSALRKLEAEVPGRRKNLVSRVVRERSGEGFFVLHLHPRDGRIEATLRDATGRLVREAVLSASPLEQELADLAKAYETTKYPVVVLEGDVDDTTDYRVMRLLPAHEVRAGGSSMRRPG